MRRIIALAATGLVWSAAHAADRTATAYQVTPAHNAVVKFSQTWGPKLTPQWTAQLDGPPSYPLVANGIVYALVTGSPDEIVAINATTGAIVWKVSTGSNASIGLAYDEGLIYTVNSGGTLTSFDTKKGKLAWSEQLPGQYYFSSEPSALNGVVYVGGAGDGGTVYAVDGKTGKLLWTQSVENGDDSSPAVTNTVVYVSYPCQYYDLSPKTGSIIWQYSGDCEGGGGATVVVGAGLAFVRDPYGDDSNTIFDAATGASVGTFAATAPPAIVSKKVGYFLDGGTLSAVSPKTNQLLWEFTKDEFEIPPLAANGWLVGLAESGTLYVLNGQTGAVGFSTSVGYSSSYTIGAGGGIVLVPVGSTLVAFGSTT
jgi:outer membrane protein assembly factor BamB